MNKLFGIFLALLLLPNITLGANDDVSDRPELGTATSSDSILSVNAGESAGSRLARILFQGTNGYVLAGDGSWIAVPTKATLGLDTDDNVVFSTINITGSSLSFNNSQVVAKWVTGVTYQANVNAVVYGGKIYICKAGHLAASETEPGVGALWENAWTEFAGSGSSTLGALTDITGEGTADYMLYDDGDGTFSFRAAPSGTFPGFNTLVADYGFDPDTKQDVSTMEYVDVDGTTIEKSGTGSESDPYVLGVMSGVFLGASAKASDSDLLDNHDASYFQIALSLIAGTYTDGNLCTYTSSGTLLNCNTPTSTFQAADADTAKTDTAANWTAALQGRAKFNSYSAAQTLTAANNNGGIVQMTTADEVTMWDCETANVGDFVLLWARDAEKIEAVPASGDHFVLFDGTALTADYELDMAATAGTKVSLMCTADDTWSVYTETAASTDGGAAD